MLFQIEADFVFDNLSWDAITANMAVILEINTTSRGTKVEKMLTLATERYTVGFCMIAKVNLWCI